MYSTFDSEVFIYTTVLFCQNGARIVKSPVRGKVASTEKGGSNSWIDLGNFTGKMSAAKSWVTHKVDQGNMYVFLEFYLLTRFWHVAEVSFSLCRIISFYSNRKSNTSIFIYLFIFILNVSAHQWTHKLKSIGRHMKEHGVEKQTLTDNFSDLKNWGNKLECFVY